MNSILYILALTTLIARIGLPMSIPITIATTEVSDSQNLPPGITPLNLWKGIVGILNRPLLMPTEYSLSVWQIAMKECSEARNSFFNAFQYWDTQTTNPVVKRKIQKMQEKINQVHIQYHINLYPEGKTKNPSNWCPKTMPALFSPTTCKIFKDHAASLQLEDVDDSKTLAAGAALLDQFHLAVEEIFLNLKVMEEGKVPVILQPLIDSQCQEVFHQCASTNLLDMKEISAYGRVIDIKRVKMANESLTESSEGESSTTPTSTTTLLTTAIVTSSSKRGKRSTEKYEALQFELLTPCLTNETLYGEYNIYTLPYFDSANEVRQVELSENEATIAVQFSKENGFVTISQLIEEKIECEYVSHTLAATCQKGNNIKNFRHFEAQGAVIKTKVPTVESQDRVMVQNIGRSQYLIFTPESRTAQLKCADVEHTFRLQGYYLAKIQNKCKMKIEESEEELEGYQTPTEIYRLRLLTAIMPKVLTAFVDKNVEILTFGQLFWKFVKKHWYLVLFTVLTIPCSIPIFVCIKRNSSYQHIIARLRRNRQKRMRVSTRPNKRRTKEYVLRPRTP